MEGGIKYHFLVFDMTRPGIEPWSPGPLANTVLIGPMTNIYIYICVCVCVCVFTNASTQPGCDAKTFF